MTRKIKDANITVWDPEYNPLSRTLKVTLVLNEEAIREVMKTRADPPNTPEEVTRQVVELLERSIQLNLPTPRQAGPGGDRWNHDQ